ncbi:MAG TPA: Ig-like domain-containing protein [Candidatus Paceibacterota bacterium]
MRKGFYICIFAGLVAVFSLALVPNQAQAITNTSSTLSTSYGGRTDTDHLLSFTAGATLVAGGRIAIIFPTSFQFDPPGTENAIASGSITVSSATVATATLSVGANDQTLTLWLAAVDGVDALNTTTVHLAGLSMAYPASGGTHTLAIQTKDTSAAVIEEASSTAFTLIAANVAVSQTQSIQTVVTPPSSKITSPTAGASIAAGQDYVIKGTAADLGVKDVSKVEVSVDGGSTWITANLTKVSGSNFTWEYTWKAPAEGIYTIKTRATDTAGNVESPASGVKVTVTAAPTPVPVVEKPISEMTTSELQAKITQLQQTVLALLQQLVSILTQQL